jgi:hypothetical protein
MLKSISKKLAKEQRLYHIHWSLIMWTAFFALDIIIDPMQGIGIKLIFIYVPLFLERHSIKKGK